VGPQSSPVTSVTIRGQNSRSQYHKVQKHIEGNRVAGVSLHLNQSSNQSTEFVYCPLQTWTAPLNNNKLCIITSVKCPSSSFITVIIFITRRHNVALTFLTAPVHNVPRQFRQHPIKTKITAAHDEDSDKRSANTPLVKTVSDCCKVKMA